MIDQGSVKAAVNSDATVAFPFSVAAPAALTPPAPLPEGERGERLKRASFLCAYSADP